MLRFAFSILGRRTGNSRGFFGSITGLREDKMRGPELFTPAEPAMGNFASLVGATLVLDAAEKWACPIRHCNNATFHSRHSATGDSRQRPLCANSRPSRFRHKASALHPKADSTQKLGHVRKVPILFSNSGSGCQALQRSSLPGPLFSPR